LAQALARLHRATIGFVPPAGARVKKWDADRMSGATLGDFAPPPQLVEAVARLGTNDWQLINADIGLHNTAWRAHVPGLYDFNDTGWGYTGFDLARFVFGFDVRTKECALDGYASIASLPISYVEFGGIFEDAAARFLRAYRSAKRSL
jgi:Ser/Thr protein kinase RdoA (MazF antagonist)